MHASDNWPLERPDASAKMMSGDGAGLGPIQTDGPFHFMAQPFGRDELTAKVAQVLADG
jgi:hypothetical protein